MSDLPAGFVPAGQQPGNALQSQTITQEPGLPPGFRPVDTGAADPSFWDRIGNFMTGPGATMAIRGITGIPDALSDPLSIVRRLISPELENIEQSARLGHLAGDAAFKATGLPEYQAETPAGRVGMAAGTGMISGAPLGLLSAGGVAARAIPSAMTALSGAAGQTVRETLPGWERLATAAELVPGGALAARRAFSPQQQAEIPTTTELRDVGRQQRLESGKLGVEVYRDPLAQRANTVLDDLYRDGVDPLDIPQTLRAVQKRIDTGGEPLSIGDFHTVRRALGRIVDSNSPTTMTPGNPAEVQAALGIRKQLDDHIATLDQNPQNVSSGAGNAAEAAGQFRDFLGNYASAMRSNRITGDLQRGIAGISGKAEGLADTQPGAGNFDRSLRSQIRQFLGNDSNLTGFSNAEIAALNDAMTGGIGRNTARAVAATLGGTPSFQALTTGGIGGGVANLFGGGPISTTLTGLGLPATGIISRMIQNNLARRSIGSVDETVRMNSPEYRARLANLPDRDPAVAQTALPGLLAPQPGPTAGADQNPLVNWMQASGIQPSTPVLDMLQRLLR